MKYKNYVLKVAAFFYRDFHWKILALSLAFILWFVGVNVTNPIQTYSYPNLTLNILGRDQLAQNEIVLLNEQQLNNTRISVTIRATSSDHAAINAARSDNIQASIDLRNINFDQVVMSDGPVTVPVDVNVFIHQQYDIRIPTPSTVDLILDRHEERLMPIVVDVMGAPEEGFENLPYVHTPRVVRLTGARSILEDVSDVRVWINVNNANEAVEEPRPLVVYNSTRQDITDSVGLSVSSTNVVVPIFPYADIRLDVNRIGTPLPGFMATETVIVPQIVSVVGDADIIAETSSIILGDIDITLARSTIEQTFDINQALMGSGLTLRTDASSEASATVIVEQVIERNMELPLENVSVGGYARPFTFATEGPITLTLRGRESVISGLSLNQIGASLDLTGLGAGTHQLQVEIVTPPGAVLVNLVTVEVTIEPEPIVFDPEDYIELIEGAYD